MLTGIRCTSVPAPQSSRRRQGRRWMLVLAGALAGSLVFAVMHRALTDDSYITLAYARNLGLHGQWAMVEGLTANTATSPLNVLLLGAVTFLVRDATVAAGLVTAGLLAFTGRWLEVIARGLGWNPWLLPILGVGLLATSPLLISTLGLETYLAVTLMVGLVRYALPGQWWLFGVITGLLVLTRPDLGAVALVAVLFAGRSWWRAAGAATVTALPWVTWSWFVLGSAIPDTFLIKASAAGSSEFALGLLTHWAYFPAATLLSVIPAAVGLVTLPWWWRSPVGWLWGVGAVAHYAAMIVTSAWIYHWYYGPALAGLGLVGVATVARAAEAGAALRWLAGGSTAAILAVSLAFDVQAGLPRERATIAINWGTAAQYEALAATLPVGSTVGSPGEVGTLAYHCDCRIVDGLSDRGYFSEALPRVRDTLNPFWRWLFDLNYRHFEPVAPQVRHYQLTSEPGPEGRGFRLDGAWPKPDNPTDSRRIVLGPPAG